MFVWLEVILEVINRIDISDILECGFTFLMENFYLGSYTKELLFLETILLFFRKKTIAIKNYVAIRRN